MQACTQCRHPYSPTMKQQPSEAFTPQQQEGCEQEHKEEEGGQQDQSTIITEKGPNKKLAVFEVVAIAFERIFSVSLYLTCNVVLVSSSHIAGGLITSNSKRHKPRVLISSLS